MNIFGAAIGLFALFFILIIASTFLGGVVGMIIGWVFPSVIDTVNTVAGVELSSFQLGAVLGFLGSFFRNPPVVGK